MAVRCSDCEAELEEQQPSKPCPRCGGTRRTFTHAMTGGIAPGGNAGASQIIQLAATGMVMSSGHAVMTVIRHWQHLFKTVDQLLEAGHYGAAVIVAQTACEVVMARAISMATPGQPGHEDLRQQHKLQSYSPDNKKVRKLYKKLTKDALGKLSCWQKYQDMLEHRHNAVHAGANVPEAAAREGVAAAKELVDHVVLHNGMA